MFFAFYPLGISTAGIKRVSYLLNIFFAFMKSEIFIMFDCPQLTFSLRFAKFPCTGMFFSLKDFDEDICTIQPITVIYFQRNLV